MEEPAAEEEEGVLRDYLAYYAARGAEGRLAACDEAALKARARRLPERRGALDVRGVAERCRRARGRRGGSVLRDLLKALEVLELLCVNLLLSPWRKEIRSLKVGGAAFPRPFPGPRPCPAAGSGSGCAGHRRRSDLKTARPFRLASVRGAALFAPTPHARHRGSDLSPGKRAALVSKGRSPALLLALAELTAGQHLSTVHFDFTN